MAKRDLGRVAAMIREWLRRWLDIPNDQEPGSQCRWMEISFHCRCPVNESENLPSGCDAHCPARVQNEIKAEILEHENMRNYN